MIDLIQNLFYFYKCVTLTSSLQQIQSPEIINSLFCFLTNFDIFVKKKIRSNMRMVRVGKIVCFLLSLLLFTACGDDVEIETGEATDVTTLSARVTCRIISSDVSLTNAKCGVLYSTSRRDVDNGAGADAIGELNGDFFTVALSFTTLDDVARPGTRYYYRGYVNVKNDWYYGDVRVLYTGGAPDAN